MKYKKIGVLINPRSGCFSTGEIQVDDVKAEFAKHRRFFSDIRFFMSGGRFLSFQLKQLKEYGPDLAVAAGGDGTVGALVNSFPTEDKPIAIIPCGTFNHFATDAGIPRKLGDAVHAVFSGTQVEVDAAALNGRRFINNSSIGLYPHSVEVRENLEKKYGHNRWLFLFLAFLRIFTRFPLYKITLRINGREEHHVVSSLFVGNNKYEVDLLKFGSRESLRDGKLSLYFSKCRHRRRFIKSAFFLVLGKLEKTEHLEFTLAEKIDLNTTQKRVKASTDGEVIKLNPPLSYESLPGAVKIVLPQNNRD